MIKREVRQECTHVDFNQLDDPLPFQIYTNNGQLTDHDWPEYIILIFSGTCVYNIVVCLFINCSCLYFLLFLFVVVCISTLWQTNQQQTKQQISYFFALFFV